jgi:hypothetical protein
MDHERDTVSAPETIWAKSYAARSAVQKGGYWQNEPILPNTPANQGVEYRRADLPRPEDAARIAELEAASATLRADALLLAQATNNLIVIAQDNLDGMNPETRSSCEGDIAIARAAIAALKGTPHE